MADKVDRPAPVRRDRHGRFLRGASGNPAGRAPGIIERGQSTEARNRPDVVQKDQAIGNRRSTAGFSRGESRSASRSTQNSDAAAQPACSVVGSIILRTSVILVAGKPLISARFLMMSSSLAR